MTVLGLKVSKGKAGPGLNSIHAPPIPPHHISREDKSHTNLKQPQSVSHKPPHVWLLKSQQSFYVQFSLLEASCEVFVGWDSFSFISVFASLPSVVPAVRKHSNVIFWYQKFFKEIKYT